MCDRNGDPWYSSTYIRTYTGRVFWPLEPRIEDIDIVDIAHALSNVCRFTGHVRKFYSVAQHCVLLSRITEETLPWGLLHDASEAYIADIARPIKHTDTFAAYRGVEARLEAAVYERFGLLSHATQAPAYVKEADTRMLYTERRDLLDCKENEKCYGFKIIPWSPKKAEHEFLRRFVELGGRALAA